MVGRKVSIKAGDKFLLNCGVEVEVVEYRDSVNVTVIDKDGNTKTAKAEQIRNKSLKWNEFGNITHRNRQKDVFVGDRFLNNCSEWFEVVEYISSSKIKIRFDSTGNERWSQKGKILDLTSQDTAKKLEEIKTARYERENRELAKWDYLKPVKDRHYIYMAFIEDEIVYIGKGIGRRYLHPNSGMSHNFQLNKLYFEGAVITVSIFKDDLSSDEAAKLEKELIDLHSPRCNVRYYKIPKEDVTYI